MNDARRALQPWKVDDDIEAVRLQSMQDLAEGAQLTAVSPNVRIYKGAQGGTAIAVDEIKIAPPEIVEAIVTEEADPAADNMMWCKRLVGGVQVGEEFPVVPAAVTSFNGSDETWAWLTKHNVGETIYAFRASGGQALGSIEDEDENVVSIYWQELLTKHVTDFAGYYVVAGASPDGPNRWSYTMHRVKETSDGTSWEDAGDLPMSGVRNDQEVFNTSTDVQGNGTDVGNYVGTMALMPAPVGRGVHRVYVTTYNTAGALNAHFSHVNAVDGSCTA